MRRLAALPLLVVLAWPSPAAAYTAVDKLLRGLAGMTTGFLEVPGNMVAGMFGFQKQEFFETETAAERQAPQVKF